MGPSRSPSYFWDRMHSSVKEQKGKDFHGPILGPGGNHKIVKMQQRLTLQTKKGIHLKEAKFSPERIVICTPLFRGGSGMPFSFNPVLD